MTHRIKSLALMIGLAIAAGAPLAAAASVSTSYWYSPLYITAPTSTTAGATGLIATVQPPQTGTTFAWTVTGGTIQGTKQGSSIVFTASQAGTLTLYCTATNAGRTCTGTFTVQVKGVAPAAPVITAPTSVTANVSGLSATVKTVAGVTYSWVISGNGSAVSGSTSSTLIFKAGGPGLLTLTCTASNAYGSTSAQAQIQVKGVAPVTPVITAPASASANTAGLTASVPAQSGCSYAWTILDGTLVSGSSTATLTFKTGATGILTLGCTVSNTYGSSNSQAQVTVLTSAPATPVITAPSQVHAQSVANAASVTAQSGCSYAWSITDGTLTTGQGTAAVTFTAGAAGTLQLSCTVTNQALVSAKASASVAVLPLQASGYYGSGLNVDCLANTPIGKAAGFQVSYRIRANHSGALQAFRPFFIWSDQKAGYAAGTGGTLQIQLQSDDGSASHLPSGTVLASMVYANPLNVAIGYYPELVFPSQPQLKSGTLYHLVFSNIDADPTDNWICLDSAYMDAANSPMQPTIADTDLATLWRTGATGAWSLRGLTDSPTESFTPILELDYADGASQGQGYMEFWIGNAKTISGAQAVRETFTVSSSNRIVTGAALRLKYISGSSPLTIRLEQADGTLIDQETVSSLPVSAGSSGDSWAKVSFATARTLTAGQSYHLVLSAPADTVFTAYPMRKGSDKGYKSTAVFTDGYAQFNPGTGWIGWDQWGQSNRTDGDLQFYFTVAQ